MSAQTPARAGPARPPPLASLDVTMPTTATTATSAATATTTAPAPLTPTNSRALYDTLRAEAAAGRAYWTEEQFVPDVTIAFLYKPHTLTALALLLALMVALAFHPDADRRDMMATLRVGFSVAAAFIIILGLLVFPTGPFHRPHPLVWRFAFGLGVVYEIFLLLVLFSSLSNARQLMTFLDSSLGVPLKERSYAADCSFTWANVSATLFDQFALSHFIGWIVKSVIIRDNVLCWVMSIQWELLEIALTHHMSNFAECWWDQWLLDVLLCNGLGIYVGSVICERLEMRKHVWRGVSEIPTTCGKLSRIALQFTPESWMKVRWEKTKSLKNFFAVQALVFGIHAAMLNAFYLKYLLWVPPPCSLNLIRLIIWAFVGTPTVRQVYIYLNDPLSRRIGTHTFLSLVILSTETLISVKFGAIEFANARMPDHIRLMCQVLVGGWLLWNVYIVRGILARREGSSSSSSSSAAAIASGSSEEGHAKSQ